jgi:tetratricopeptide (TPR) repeat protein
VDYLAKRIEDDPGNIRLKNHLAVLYGRYGRESEARKLLQDIVRNRDYLPALVNLANIALRGSDFEQARDYYHRALNQDSNNIAALVGLAQLEHAAGNQSEAQQIYDRLTELDSSVAERLSHIASGSSSAASRAASAGSMNLEWEVEE